MEQFDGVIDSGVLGDVLDRGIAGVDRRPPQRVGHGRFGPIEREIQRLARSHELIKQEFGLARRRCGQRDNASRRDAAVEALVEEVVSGRETR